MHRITTNFYIDILCTFHFCLNNNAKEECSVVLCLWFCSLNSLTTLIHVIDRKIWSCSCFYTISNCGSSVLCPLWLCGYVFDVYVELYKFCSFEFLHVDLLIVDAYMTKVQLEVRFWKSITVVNSIHIEHSNRHLISDVWYDEQFRLVLIFSSSATWIASGQSSL